MRLLDKNGTFPEATDQQKEEARRRIEVEVLKDNLKDNSTTPQK
jgi:hypothetical protein